MPVGYIDPVPDVCKMCHRDYLRTNGSQVYCSIRCRENYYETRDLLSEWEPQAIDENCGPVVYFMHRRPGDDLLAPVKVGKAKVLGNRLRAHRTALPSAHVFAVLDGYTELEGDLHRLAAAWRIEQEWFCMCPPLAEALVKCDAPIAAAPRQLSLIA